MTKINELTGVVSLDLSKAPEIPAESATIEAVAKRFEVTDERSFAEATLMIQSSAAAIAKVEGFFEADKNLAHRLHASICEKIRSITAPWRAVRPALEPRMKKYVADREARARAEEAERLRADQERQRQANEEAARIQREADAAAAKLRQDGDMRGAREKQIEAARQAAEGVEAAKILSDIGTVRFNPKPVGGLGEVRAWQGEVVDIRQICKAIGDGTIPLEYLTPVRGQGDQMVPLVEINMACLNNLAKRRGAEDIGVPGAKGLRSMQLKFSTKNAPVPEPVFAGGGEEENW